MRFADKGAARFTCMYQSQGYTFDDFQSAAYEGLVIAARKFRPELGCKFATYAFHRINAKLIRHLSDTKVATGWSRGPTQQEQAEGKKGMQRRVRVEGMPTFLDKHGEEHDFEVAAPFEDPAEQIERDQRIAMVLASVVDEGDRHVLAAMFRGETANNIAERLGVTRQMVSVRYKRAIASARAALGVDGGCSDQPQTEQAKQ